MRSQARFTGWTKRSGALAFALALAQLSAAPDALAQSNTCTNPGKDGPVSMTGIINTYYPCVQGTNVSAGSTTIAIGTIDARGNATVPAAGDLLMVMQVQDADINDANTTSYGGSTTNAGYTALNNAGVYEYATVASFVSGTATVTNGLLNSYRCQAYVAGTSGQRAYQVIRVPQASSVTLTGTLTAPNWNGATGGVTAFDDAGNLNWNGQTVNLTGLGFRGGGGLYLQGPSASGGTYKSTDAVTLSTYLSTITITGGTAGCSTCGPFAGQNAVKGEGIAGTPRYVFVPTTQGEATNGAGVIVDTGVEGYPDGCMAMGAPGNAGGGGTDNDAPPTTANYQVDAAGNDWNSGGGGGGGYAAGGQGGIGWDGTDDTCPSTSTYIANSGGFGGAGISMAIQRLTMGGGGGAGSSNNGGGNPNYNIADSGAPGGGVVVIRAATASGTGTVTVNGANGDPVNGTSADVCNDAAGGGGGGGAALIFASNNSGSLGTLTVNANGGSGGNNSGNSGAGNNATTCGATSGGVPHGPGGGGGGGFVALTTSTGVTINVNGGAAGTTATSTCTTSSYGSSSTAGGYNVFTIPPGSIPGSQASPYCYPDLTVTKTTGLSNTVEGWVTNYTVTVTNATGYGQATNVVMTDVLPGLPNPSGLFNYASTTSITYTGGASRSSTVNPAVGATSPAIGNFTIPGGGSVAITFVANVPAATTLGVYQNAANVVYDDPTRTTAGQTVTPGGTYQAGGFVPGSNYTGTGANVTVWAPATITKSFSPISINAGGTSTLTVTINNPNTTAVTAAGFTDTFPSGLLAVGGSVTESGTGCTGGFTPTTIAASATSWSEASGAMAASGTCIFTISVTASVGASYTNSVAVDGFVNNLNIINVATATATLLSRPTIVKSFVPPGVGVSSPSTMTLAIVNPNTSSVTGTTFSDSFPAGLVATGGTVSYSAGCSGSTPTTIAANSTSFSMTAGTVAASSTCTVTFSVQSSTIGSYSNTAGAVTTTTTVLAGNGSNTALLSVGGNAMTQVFGTPTINSGGTSTLTYTLTNATGGAETGLNFTDSFPAGMSAANATIGGTCTGVTATGYTTGSTAFNVTAGSLPTAGCTIIITVTSSTPGVESNSPSGITTTQVTGAGPGPVAASLTVMGAPTIANAFNPTTIQTGNTTTITYTLTNNAANGSNITGATFTDTLNAAIAVAGSGTVAAGGTCAGASGNTFTAGTLGATLTFSGLTIPTGGGGCTVTISVTSSTISTTTGYTNTTSTVTSTNAPASGTSTAPTNLIVLGPPTINKAFGTSPISQNGTSTITFTLTNPNPSILTGAAFTDTLANMTISATAAAGGTCTGAGGNSFTLGQTALTFSGLSIPASGTCTVTVVITSGTGGTNPNTTSGVTSTSTPTAGAVSNTASLQVYLSPTAQIAFNQQTILSSAALSTSSSTLTITLTNANAIALTGVGFTDTLSDMYIYATNPAGGTCSQSPANNFAVNATSLTFANITIPANSSCTITIVVASSMVSPAAGWPNQTSGVTSSQTPVAGAVPLAAYLNVLGTVVIAKSFSPSGVAKNTNTTMTLTLTNPNATELTNVAFSDTLPTNMSAATQTFGGTCTANPTGIAATATVLSWSGMTLTANQTCTLTIVVQASANATYTNTTSGVTSSQTGATVGATATAKLAVGDVGITKAFSTSPATAPPSMGLGDTATLTFTLTNGTGGNVNTISFVDTFPTSPAQMSLANTTVTPTNNGCSGTYETSANGALAVGSTSFKFVGNNTNMANNGTCTIAITVTVPNLSTSVGTYSNITTGNLTWNGGGTGTTSNTATLNVFAMPTISKAFSPTSLDAYATSSITFTLGNTNATQALTSCLFTDTLATNLKVATPPTVTGTCVGVTGTPAAGATSLSLTVPSVSPGGCTVIVPVESGTAATYNNTSSGVTCYQTLSAGAVSNTTSVTVNKAAATFVKTVNPATAAPGSNVTYTMTYGNPNSTMQLETISITDATPPHTTFQSASCGAPLPASITACTVSSSPAVGGTGTVTWTLTGDMNAGTSGTVILVVQID